LYVIDGVKQKPGTANLPKIDMANIASIEVLKDQTATALYGDDGKNGVIIVTTKGKKATTKP
jgi:TonB-dependent SusC/RagA subfamily outer membrane receptor